MVFFFFFFFLILRMQVINLLVVDTHFCSACINMYTASVHTWGELYRRACINVLQKNALYEHSLRQSSTHGASGVLFSCSPQVTRPYRLKPENFHRKTPRLLSRLEYVMIYSSSLLDFRLYKWSGQCMGWYRYSTRFFLFSFSPPFHSRMLLSSGSCLSLASSWRFRNNVSADETTRTCGSEWIC